MARSGFLPLLGVIGRVMPVPFQSFVLAGGDQALVARLLGGLEEPAGISEPARDFMASATHWEGMFS